MNLVKKGYLLMLGSTFFGALMYLAGDFLFRRFEDITPENAAFWGYVGTLLVITPYFLRSHASRTKLKTCFEKDGKVLFLVSFLTAISSFLWWFALIRTNSGWLILFSKSDILFTFLLGVIFLKEKVTFRELLGIFIAGVGFFFLSTLEGEVTLWLVFLTLVCRFLYALQSFFIKKYAPGVDSSSFGFLRSVFILGFLGIAFGLFGKISFISFVPFLFATIALISGGIFSKILYFEAHNLLDISRLNIFLLLTPVFVLSGGYFLWGDHLSASNLGGATLVLGGILYFSLQRSAFKR